MARNDDRDRIGADRGTDILGHAGIGMTERPAQLTVAGGLSGRDLAKRRPDLALKVAAIGGHRNIVQCREIALEVAIELPGNRFHGLGLDAFAQFNVVEALAQLTMQPHLVVGEIQSAHDTLVIGDEQHFAQRRFDPV